MGAKTEVGGGGEEEGLLERGGLNRGFKILLLVFCLSVVKKSIKPALIASKS